MSQQEVFEVVEAAFCKDDTWVVKGRAYEDIKVGDVLSVDSAEPSNGVTSVHFRVVAISTYGREVEELYRMMTGELTLRGLHGDRLKESRLFVRPSQSRDPSAPAVTRQIG